MEFFGRDCGGGTLLGLHHRGRYNRIFDVLDCRLQSQLSNRIFSIPCVVREGRNPGEVMVNLVVSEYPDKGVGDLVRCVLERVPEITTFVVTLHRGKAQPPSENGSSFSREAAGSRKSAEGSGSRFQRPSSRPTPVRQRFCTSRSLALAGDLTGATVLDLYCGTGGISLHLAKRADRVI
jgi:23S rRNA (uracil1939-C5)-methyltransferase